MSIASPGPAPSLLSWGVGLAATSLVLIGGGALIWNHQAPPIPPTDPGFTGQPIAVSKIAVAPDGVPDVTPGIGLHSIAFTDENGIRVVKIRVSPDGDELIVDARTGRLIEARPGRPTGAGPMGKFAAPFLPVT